MTKGRRRPSQTSYDFISHFLSGFQDERMAHGRDRGVIPGTDFPEGIRMEVPLTASHLWSPSDQRQTADVLLSAHYAQAGRNIWATLHRGGDG